MGEPQAKLELRFGVVAIRWHTLFVRHRELLFPWRSGLAV
jgi:hypothetical protein